MVSCTSIKSYYKPYIKMAITFYSILAIYFNQKKRCRIGHLLRQPNQGSNKVCVRTGLRSVFTRFYFIFPSPVSQSPAGQSGLSASFCIQWTFGSALVFGLIFWVFLTRILASSLPESKTVIGFMLLDFQTEKSQK